MSRVGEHPEASHRPVTIRESVVKLLTTAPEKGWTVDDWTEGLLRLAAEGKGLTLRVARGEDATLPRHLQIVEAGEITQTEDSAAIRVIRPLLARLAVKAQEELGIAFDPYGGRFAFTREAVRGVVRIEIEFTNTSRDQSLVLTTKTLPAIRKPTAKKPAATGH